MTHRLIIWNNEDGRVIELEGLSEEYYKGYATAYLNSVSNDYTYVIEELGQ